jgi:hypothetical protein
MRLERKIELSGIVQIISRVKWHRCMQARNKCLNDFLKALDGQDFSQRSEGKLTETMRFLFFQESIVKNGGRSRQEGRNDVPIILNYTFSAFSSRSYETQNTCATQRADEQQRKIIKKLRKNLHR